MNPDIWVAAISAGSSVAVAITALMLNHRGFADLRSDMEHRFADLRSEMDRGFAAVEKRFDDLYRYIDLRFNGLEERVTKLEDRLEHPIERPV